VPKAHKATALTRRLATQPLALAVQPHSNL